MSGGLIGDTVEARITENGSSFSRATVEEVIEPSPMREHSPCPFAGICGGARGAAWHMTHNSKPRRKTSAVPSCASVNSLQMSLRSHAPHSPCQRALGIPQ